MVKQVGHRIIGIVKSVRGECACGHKEGDRFELSNYSSGDLCGAFYHDIYPYIIMLQFGGQFPASWGGDILRFCCLDKKKAVTIELRRG